MDKYLHAILLRMEKKYCLEEVNEECIILEYSTNSSVIVIFFQVLNSVCSLSIMLFHVIFDYALIAFILDLTK
ncbi:11243_t:CDS:2 [Scutellospora calospora]|uniref:11243_t:CDS:1 n=1 Tax=Scutellospora calospora TaxID=85575 RepID=A0ACA9K010_9GLOM|nr:11243_t:CDS:2 [Scutellospora calospora]